MLVCCLSQAACAAAPKGPDPDAAAIVERMRHIKHKARAARRARESAQHVAASTVPPAR